MRSRKSSPIAAYLLLACAVCLARVLAWTCDSPRNVTLTKPMLDDLTLQIQNKILSLVRTDPDGQQYYALVPGFVRLAFHACSAKWCSSRIDLSELGNNGLNDAVSAADELHAALQRDPKYTGFSKADLYALCGVAAIGVATGYRTRVNFRYGRPDFCPRDDPKTLNQTLPGIAMDTEATYAFMKRFFNFTPKETVTIMGAHSLGVARNFLRPPVPITRWVNSPADSLTNKFYQAMLDPRWRQIDRLNAGLRTPAKVWVIDGMPTRLMFDTDIGLMLRLTSVNASVTSRCTTFVSCPFAPTARTVVQYAMYEDSFLNDFARVFTKMIENGLSHKLINVVANDYVNNK